MTIRPWTIAAIYAAVGALWIGISDSLLEAIASSPRTRFLIEVSKGWFYVALTTLLIYLLVRRLVRSTERNRIELGRRVSELETAARDLLVTEDHLRDALGRAGEVAWEWQADDGSVQLSPELRTVLDTPDVPLTMPRNEWWSLLHPDDRGKVERTMEKVFSGQLDRYELVFRVKRRDGGWRWLLSTGGLDRRKSGQGMRAVGTVRDITEIHQRDEDIRQINLALHALIGANRAIVQAHSREELLNGVCDKIVNELALPLAWIGQAMDDDRKSVRILAAAGPAKAYVDRITVTWGDGPTGLGLTGSAIRSGRVEYTKDMTAEPRFEPWLDVAKEFGLVSSVAIPIVANRKSWGALIVHGLMVEAFGDREREVLANLGDDIGHALTAFEAAERAERAEAGRAKALQDVHHANLSAVQALAAAVEARDPYTAGHEARVADLAVKMGERMGLSRSRIAGLLLGGNLHDIGKIGVPAEILAKPGRLSTSELAVVREHPAIGRTIVRNIHFPWPIAEIVGQHHERLDGSGYPDGLKGDQIALEAQILAVADVVEAMMSHRPYRPALPVERAVEELRSGRERLYRADAVDICLALIGDPSFALDGGGGLDRLPTIAAEPF